MSQLPSLPVVGRWPARRPDCLQLYSVNAPDGVKMSMILEEIGQDCEATGLFMRVRERRRVARTRTRQAGCSARTEHPGLACSALSTVILTNDHPGRQVEAGNAYAPDGTILMARNIDRQSRPADPQAAAMIGRRASKAFAKSVLTGAIAAALLPTIMVAVMLLASVLTNPAYSSDLGPALALLLLPFITAVLVIAASGALIGVPVTMALKWLRRESEVSYTIAGGILGCTIPLTWIAMSPAGGLDPWLALVGLIGGAVTSRTWWTEARRE